MILNLKDFQYNIDQLSRSVNNNAVNIGALQRAMDDVTISIGALESFLNNLSGLSQEVADLSIRAANLETNMHKWTKVGSYSEMNNGTYITPPIALSECKEVMLLLYREMKVIGSLSIPDINQFKSQAISISVRDGSTTRSAMITLNSDGRIYFQDVVNADYLYIYVR